MKVPIPDITKALVSELKGLRDKHHKFQTRVIDTAKAARARDEEARRLNQVLTQRIIGLENELKQAKESIAGLQEFIELLPSVKHEIDSFEDVIDSFEVLGCDPSGMESTSSVIERVDALENGVRAVMELHSSSETELFDLLSGTTNDFSAIEGSEPTGLNDQRHESSLEPPIGTSSALTSEVCQFPSHFAEPIRLLDPHPEPPMAASQPIEMTNRERLELITNLMNQPLKNGDIWFIIPQLWFDDWKTICVEKPDETNTKVGTISTSILLGKKGKLLHDSSTKEDICYSDSSDPSRREAFISSNPKRRPIHSSAWHQLINWYGCESVLFPRLVMPEGLEGRPYLVQDPRVRCVYFLLPPGSPGPSVGDYTPRVVFPKNCLVKTLRSMITNALPSYPSGHSIEFFCTNVKDRPNGWHIWNQNVDWADATPALMQWQLNQLASIRCQIIVSVKVLDETTGFMVNIDPFPAPSCPPRIITWTSACA